MQMCIFSCVYVLPHKYWQSDRLQVYVLETAKIIKYGMVSQSPSIEGLCERIKHLDIFLFPPITQWCSISYVLFTGERGVSDFNVLKYYSIINYSVNILNECLHILIDCSQLSKTYYNVLFGSSTQDRHARRIYRRTFSADETSKITRSASDPAENLQLYRVVQFFHPRLSCSTTHISTDVQRITLNASCMTIWGERTEQLDIFCHVTGFTSDFLNFIVVEHIRFFTEPFNWQLMSSQISLMWNQIEKLIKRGTKKDTSEREKSKENSRINVVTNQPSHPQLVRYSGYLSVVERSYSNFYSAIWS